MRAGELCKPSPEHEEQDEHNARRDEADQNDHPVYRHSLMY